MEKKRKMSKKRIVEEDIIEIKRRRREVGHEGRNSPVETYVYNGHTIPGKCSPERARSFFGDGEFMPPRIVSVEPSAGCNLRCLMCATHLTEKSADFLDFGIFERVVAEAVSFQEFFVFQGTGEPMLHRRLFEMVAHARTAGIRNILISTNGTCMNNANIDRSLARSTAPDFLQFSIDGHTPDLYEKYRKGAKFRKVHGAIRKLHAERAARGLDFPEITINTLLSADTNLTAFLELWGPYVDDVTVSPMLNQASQLSSEVDFLTAKQARGEEYISCPKPYEIISVMANGQITHCQHDYHRLHVKGNITTGDTLLGTWRNVAYNEFRSAHIQGMGEKTSCQGCDHMYRVRDEAALFDARRMIADYFSI